jgi:hypothetical protein
MFRAMIKPIFRSARLCITACGIMHPSCCRPVAWKRSSSAPENGRDHRPKHAEMIGIITKPLLLHLVGVYIISACTVWTDTETVRFSRRRMLIFTLSLSIYLFLSPSLQYAAADIRKFTTSNFVNIPNWKAIFFSLPGSNYTMTKT